MKYALSRRHAAVLATLAVCCGAALDALAAEPTAALRDSVAVHASDQMVDAAAEYCAREAPAEGARLRSAQAQWRQQHDVSAVRERLSAVSPKATAPMSPDNARRLQERMAAQGQPAKSCAQMIALLGSADMNLRERYPAAYAAAPLTAPTARATDGSTGSTGSNNAGSPRPATPTATAAAGTLLLNPAQLWVMRERTPYVKDRSQQQRLEAAGLAGPLAIKGRVVKKGSSWFIEHHDGAFRSRMSVSPGVDVSAHEGREVIVAGRLDEWPSSLAFLRNARLVDGSGLKASSEPSAPGMMRMAVEAERVRTAPGQGVATGDVAGVLYHGRGAVGANGMFTFKEDATVLLRDGWAYSRLDVPPSDLNVKASRELEPQHWGKWRRAGSGHEVQWQDDHGNAKGEWEKAEGTLKGPWPAGSRLNGSYTSANFYGSVGFGGMYVKNTHTFSADGGYEGSHYSQAGSGTVAADNGFSSGASSHSDKTGTRSTSSSTSSAGQGTPPATTAPGVTVTSNAKRDDGAQNRGRYAIDGYTLEIRRDNGRVDRYLTFKSLGDDIWIGSSSYSPPKKK